MSNRVYQYLNSLSQHIKASANDASVQLFFALFVSVLLHSVASELTYNLGPLGTHLCYCTWA